MLLGRPLEADLTCMSCTGTRNPRAALARTGHALGGVQMDDVASCAGVTRTGKLYSGAMLEKPHQFSCNGGAGALSSRKSVPDRDMQAVEGACLTRARIGYG